MAAPAAPAAVAPNITGAYGPDPSLFARPDVPPFFFAAQETGFSNPKLFRVYGDDAALLFLYAGPYQLTLIDAIHRWRGQQDGGASGNINRAMGKAVLAGARAGGLAGAGIGAAAGLIGGGVMYLGGKIAEGQVGKRAEELDAMTLEQLRQDALTGRDCFWAAPDNVSEVLLRPRDEGLFSFDDKNITGFLRFIHRPKGKTTLKLVTLPDAYDAVQHFRRVLGADNVNVRFPF